MFSRQWEPRRGVVVEARPFPLRRRVATLTVLREAGMRRIACALIVVEVAGGTRRPKTSELSPRVATRTSGRHMLAGQRESRCRVVVEFRTGPLTRVVARFAGLRKTAMRRIRGTLKIGQMAGCAGCAQPGELTAHVAGRTRCRRMFAGQREFRFSVIELRALPLHGAVAQLAILRESCSRVVRTLGAPKFVEVAGGARRSDSRELSPHMARRAGRRRVLPGQRKPCRGVVVELCSHPLRGCVAVLTSLREARVGRRLRTLIVLQMARGASGAQPGELSAGVTRGTGGRRVLPGQRKFRGGTVIERRPCPLRGCMTVLTSEREARGGMIWIRRASVRGAVAVHACRWRARELTARMTTRADHVTVFAGEGELREAVIELGALPLRRRVAALAGQREVRCSMVGVDRLIVVGSMTTAASLRSACESAPRMTRGAGRVRMRTGQSESSERIVFEPRALP